MGPSPDPCAPQQVLPGQAGPTAFSLPQPASLKGAGPPSTLDGSLFQSPPPPRPPPGAQPCTLRAGHKMIHLIEAEVLVELPSIPVSRHGQNVWD